MSFVAELKRRNVVRVGIAYVLMGWVLLQGADFVLDLIGAPEWVIRVFALAVIIGLPIALFFAWAFELTPEGIKREAEVDRANSVTRQTSRKLDFAIIGFLLLIIAFMGVERSFFAGKEQPASQDQAASTPAEVKSIAVLPFADLSEGQDQAWFADGLAEEILNALARAPDLLVSSRTATFAYKGMQVPLTQIAAELGVAHILEGSVRRSGDRIRVTAQLIRADDGFHVWSENYDRKAEDIIELQEDLAVAIAKALKTTMDPEALEEMLRAGTRSVAAYEHYLNALAFVARAASESDFRLEQDAQQEFEAARNLDPGFSDAHAKAAAYWLQTMTISRRQVARDDLSLDERMARFLERIRAAIDTAPNPVDRQRHEVQLAIAESRISDAYRLAHQVFQARPFAIDNIENLSEMAIYLADKKALREATDHLLAHWNNGVIWAIQYVESVYRMDGKVDDPAAVVSVIRDMMQRYPVPGLAYQAHRTLLWLGETEEARRLLPILANDEDGRDLVQARQACAEGRRSDAEAILAGFDSLGAQDQATSGWHLYQLLGRQAEATALLKPYESAVAVRK
jgi:TolB-like protein